ncbi:type II secretion system protein GspD [Candidatus Omnitrophota bacterium]
MKWSKNRIFLLRSGISNRASRLSVALIALFLLFQTPLQAEENYAQLSPAQNSLLNYSQGSQAQETQAQDAQAQDKQTTDLKETESQSAVKPAAARSMQERISLDLRNIEVIDALKFLSNKAGINIIATKAVSGRVTLMVEGVPIQDIFDIMLRSNNLAYDKNDEIYNVMTQAEYKVLYGQDFADVREVSSFRLAYAIPAQAFSLLDALKSDIGRVFVDTETGNVLIMDSPQKIKVMEEALRRFEEKNLVRVFTLNYARAKDIEERLKTQLDSKGAGLIRADERSNQVIVQTLPERMKQIEGLIRLLDKKTKEVLIDARIVKVTLSDDLSTGVEWEGLFDLALGSGLSYLGSYPFSAVQAASDVWRSRQQVLDDTGYVGSYPFSGTSTNYSAGRQSIGTEEMHLGAVSKNYDFDVIIKCLQTLGNARVLSNPKLAVVNNQEAKIHVGEEIPYVISTTVGAGESTASVAEEVQFEEIGILLSVVPDINDEGYVTMKVKAEISNLLNYYITPTGNQIPIKDTSTTETTIMVKEGSTIIIGGLRKDQEVESSRQVPLLGSIPFLGRLFSVKTKTKDRTELLIILTPRLITGDVLLGGAAGTRAGEEAIKSIREYSDLTAEVFIPLEGTDKKALMPKGFKSKGR